MRSRLSWEGGDLQFTRDPRDPRRLVLYYGSFAKPYWAETLTQGEFEYVLGLEFGADRAVDLGGLFPHVDYFVSFLPRAGVALVERAGLGRPRRREGGRRRADRAVRRPRAGELSSSCATQLSSPRADLGRARQALERARRQQADWQLGVDPGLPERMRSLVAAACPEGRDCLSPASQLRMLEADPATFAEWVHATQSARDEPAVIAAHLDLVEGQLDPVPDELRRLTLEKIGELEAVGFRVVRVPAFRAGSSGPRGWPGISYVNALVVDEQVFVPRFGLGDVEDRVFRDARRAAPGRILGRPDRRPAGPDPERGATLSRRTHPLTARE